MASVVEIRGPSSPKNKSKAQPVPTKLSTPSRRTLGNIRIAKSSSLPPIDSGRAAQSSDEAEIPPQSSQIKDSSTLVEVREDISRIKTMIASGRTSTLLEYDLTFC